MDDKPQYRLSKNHKSGIAKNLIDILQKDAKITEQTKVFICNWVLSGPDVKTKAFFDVWAIVLKNYLPTTRPILFRACERVSKNGKIASFTGCIESARRFSNGRGSLIICDTGEILQFEEEFHRPGEYENTFYPLVSVLKKDKAYGEYGFSQRILDYIREDEYIMRINLGNMHSFRWIKKDK